MSSYPTPGMSKVVAILPEDVVRSVDAFGAAERRSRSSAIHVLVIEALSAHGFDVQGSQDATNRGVEGRDTGHEANEAHSGAQTVGSGR